MENNNNSEKPTLPIFDFIFGLLDRLFKDGATGKVLASRVVVVVILFSMTFIWFKGDVIANAYQASRFDEYERVVNAEKDKRFDIVIQEQLQIVHVAAHSDFSAVYIFRPKNLNYFVDLEVYEGKIPDSVDPKNMGGFPVDKTSDEYLSHLSGRSFESDSQFVFLPTTEDDKKVAYMYSCPYFNLGNIYSGSIAMYWFKDPGQKKGQLDAICNQAARAIGRSR